MVEASRTSEGSGVERRSRMKVTIGKWFGFLEITHGRGMDEVRVTIPVPVRAFQCEREAFARLKDDFNMWPREDNAYDAVEQPKRAEQMKKTESKRTMRYVS
jgi:hypothetical protein